MVLIVSHRLNTIKKADMIHVPEQGRVVQTGTHAALMAAGGRYKNLFDMQFRE